MRVVAIIDGIVGISQRDGERGSSKLATPLSSLDRAAEKDRREDVRGEKRGGRSRKYFSRVKASGCAIMPASKQPQLAVQPFVGNATALNFRLIYRGVGHEFNRALSPEGKSLAGKLRISFNYFLLGRILYVILVPRRSAGEAPVMLHSLDSCAAFFLDSKH